MHNYIALQLMHNNIALQLMHNYTALQLMHNYIALKFTITFTREVLLHVSVFHNHHQGATVCASLKL